MIIHFEDFCNYYCKTLDDPSQVLDNEWIEVVKTAKTIINEQLNDIEASVLLNYIKAIYYHNHLPFHVVYLLTTYDYDSLTYEKSFTFVCVINELKYKFISCMYKSGFTVVDSCPIVIQPD